MADRVVVTFAARYGRDLPSLTDADTLGSGDEVTLPGGARGVAHLPAFWAAKSAPGPDDWNRIIQVAIDVGGVVTIGIITNWLYDQLKGKRTGPPPTVNIDQSTHIDARVFIGHVEVNLGDRAETEQVIREAIEGPNGPADVPPQVRHEVPAIFDTGDDDEADDEAWVEYWSERGRQNAAEVARLIAEGERKGDEA